MKDPIVQNLVISTGKLEKQRRYWLEKLSGQLSIGTFIYDQTYINDNLSKHRKPKEVFRFPDELYKKILNISKNSENGVFIILAAGLSYLVSRYSGKDDAIIGTPILMKDQSVSCFNDMLPLRNKIWEKARFKDMLLQVKQTVSEAVENMNYPLEKIVKQLDLSYHIQDIQSLFDTVLIFKNIQHCDENTIRKQTCGTVFNFNLSDKYLECELSFDSILMNGISVKQLWGHFINFYRVVTRDPMNKVSDIDILSAEEKERILYHFNHTDAGYPGDKGIPTLFEEQVFQAPDRVALEYKGYWLTYYQLNRRANQLARYLHKKGIRSYSICGIMMERSIHQLVTVFAVLKLGAAFLALDARYPKNRLEFMAKDTCLQVILAAGKDADTAAGLESLAIDLNTQWPAITCETGINIAMETHANIKEKPAYIIYTSGSTGRSKGVVGLHKGVLNRCNWMWRTYPFTANDVCCQKTSINFVDSIWEMFGPLLKGVRSIIIPDQTVMDFPKFIRILKIRTVTRIVLVPGLLYRFFDRQGRYYKELPMLKFWVSSGEVLRPGFPGVFQESIPGAILLNLYGSSEVSADVTCYDTTAEKQKGFQRVPIGRPIDNTRIYIIDNHMRPVPLGVVGEMYVSGAGLAAGYLNQPELTFERFARIVMSPSSLVIGSSKKRSKVTNDQCPITNGCYYKTGDLARYLPDGTIDYISRKDQQVKIRGHRIEPGEIEFQLLKHDHINKAVVIITKNQWDDDCLCAYFTSTRHLQGSLLKNFLSQQLPGYMIPSFFVQLERMPLTPTGKINRRALPGSSGLTPEAAAVNFPYTAPRDNIEKKLVDIWREILSAKEGEAPHQSNEKLLIGIDNNFFEIGGHSLKAISLLSRIHKVFNIEISLAFIFKAPTIRRLSQYMKRAAKNIYASIEPVEEREYYALSSAQKRLFILQQMDETNASYNLPAIVQLEGKIGKEKLAGIFKKLIQRHGSLRTSFLIVENQPVQRIHKENSRFQITHYKLPSQDAGSDTNYQLKVTNIIDHFVRPFDLSRAPLFRVGLIKVGETKHVLMVDMHHIVSDGLSIDIMIREFRGYLQGKAMAGLRLRYKDFSQWQNRLKKSERIKEQEAFWMNQLAGEIPVLALPFDYPRPLIQKFEGGLMNFILGKEQALRLKQLNLETNTTIFMVLAAIFITFLSKLSHQEDIVIGSPIAGRTYGDLENIIGMFVNTLVFRSYPAKDKIFYAFLQEIKELTLKVLANQDYQYEDLVDKVISTRDMSHNPIFDVMFVLRNIEPQGQDLAGLKITPYAYEHKSSKFDMTFTVDVVGEENLRFEIEYSTALFKRHTIERFINYFKNILTSILESPGKKIFEIEMISEKERYRILYEFNNTNCQYPGNRTIDQLFALQNRRTPDQVALVGMINPKFRIQRPLGNEGKGGLTTLYITYKELNEKSDHLVQLLIEKGVKIGGIVGLMMGRSIDQMSAVLAVLKAGAAFLSLDPQYPKNRLEFIIKDANLQVIISTGKEWEIASGGDCSIIELKPDKPETAGEQDGDMPGETNDNPGEKPAYIIYTSGSTGMPKGVVGLHKGVLNRCNWMWRTFPFKPTDICCQKTSMNFVDSIWEMFGALLKGVMSVIIPDETVMDVPEFVRVLKIHRVTRIVMVPGLLYRFFDENSKYYKELPELKFWVSSGEALKPGFPTLFRQCLPDGILLNLYGSSEVSADVTYYDTADANREDRQRVPIGQPIDNTWVYILDNHMYPAPLGLIGEIYVGGAGLAAGYLNQPELTGKKFDHDLWDLQAYHDEEKKHSVKKYNKKFLRGVQGGGFFKKSPPGRRRQRVFSTGDLGRWLPNGRIEYIARKDHQVKIRGFRVELGEVETHLLALPGIKEAAAVDKTDKNGEKYLCAYLVPQQEQPLELKKIRQQISDKLPGYMIPMFFVSLDKIPLTATGKIHRQALPEPTNEAGVITVGEYLPPRNNIERKLVEIWSGLLEVDKNIIGIDSNFFEIGGHSLRAVTLISIIHKEFNVELHLGDFFRTPRIRDLGQLMVKSRKTLYIPITLLEKRNYYPLSSAQKRMYIIQQMDKNSKAYNMTNTILFIGVIDKDRFEEVFKRTIHRHETLRTSFEMKEGEPVQRVHETANFQLKYVAPPGKDINKTVESFEQPFDLSQPPLIRVGLIKLENEKHILAVNIHHIVSDGTTLNIFMKEFDRLYNGKELPVLNFQYKDFAAWQNNLVQSGEMDKQEQYWLEKYKNGIRVLELPTDYVRPAVQSFEGNLIHFSLDERQTRALKNFALEKNVTLFMVLLSVFNVVLSKLSGQEEIVLGTPVAGRNRHKNLEQLIGLFLNTLLLENFPRSEKTFEIFVKELRETTIRAFENQDYQFDDLVENVQVDRNASRNPLFDVMFVLRNMEESVVQLPGLKVEPYEYDNGSTKLDILLNGIESDGRLYFYIRYCTKLFKKTTIERLIAYFKQAVDFVLAYPGKTIAEIEIIPKEERERLLFGFNDTSSEYHGDMTIQELFENRLDKAPDKSAVFYNHQQITYAELNKKANRLAHYLRDEYQVKSNHVIGVSVGRSLEMIIAIWGIIKSGTGYVAIDPNYPKDRVDHILKDSGIQWIITDRNQSNSQLLEGFSGKNIDIQGDWNRIEGKSPENPTIINQADDLLYVIYTSGSTGMPNGAMLSHDLLTNLIQWQNNHTSIDSSLRVLQFTTINFCVSFQEIMCTLTAGGEVFLIGDIQRQDIDYLMTFLCKHRIEILYLPFSYLNFLFNESNRWHEGFDHMLKHIITAGEQLKISSSMKQFLENNPGLLIHNHYGSSEMHVVTSFTMDHTQAAAYPIPPAGKPIANTNIYILDDNLKPTPIGVWGELFVESRRELLGYINNEALTHKKMVHVPELSDKHLYRSGDIGRWLEDGNIELGSRKDFQVKIRGFRVEPGEIESKILAIEGVKDCVVVVKENKDQQKDLYAYVVLDHIDIPAVKERISNFLPKYMVPRLIRLTHLPLMPNGKVDREKLPEPKTTFQKEHQYVSPRNQLEKQVAHIWEEILGVEQVGVYTSFFDVGGNSLRSIKVNNKLKEVLKRDIPLVKMFEYTTISELAQYLADTRKKTDRRQVHLDKMVNQAKKRIKRIVKHR